MIALLEHCSTLIAGQPGSFLTFFLGGLTGSLTHCLVMCGPMLAGQTACASGCASARRNGAQLPYHLGRLLTYSALGFFVALLSRQIAAASWWPNLASAMLLIAGAMFIFSSIPSRFRQPCAVKARNQFLRGALMGFMPCGLLYAALMMAATLANPFAGALAMALFTLGTMPVLLLTSAGAQAVSMKYQRGMAQAGRVMMACNGLFLIGMAGRLVG